jgi:hypothetical protein
MIGFRWSCVMSEAAQRGSVVVAVILKRPVAAPVMSGACTSRAKWNSAVLRRLSVSARAGPLTLMRMGVQGDGIWFAKASDSETCRVQTSRRKFGRMPLLTGPPGSMLALEPLPGGISTQTMAGGALMPPRRLLWSGTNRAAHAPQQDVLDRLG